LQVSAEAEHPVPVIDAVQVTILEFSLNSISRNLSKSYVAVNVEQSAYVITTFTCGIKDCGAIEFVTPKRFQNDIRIKIVFIFVKFVLFFNQAICTLCPQKQRCVGCPFHSSEYSYCIFHNISVQENSTQGQHDLYP
jgi:hypothetical protein